MMKKRTLLIDGDKLLHLDSISKKTESEYPTSWLYIFEDSKVEMDNMGRYLAYTSAGLAVWKTKLLLRDVNSVGRCFSEFALTMELEIMELLWFLKKSNQTSDKVFLNFETGLRSEIPKLGKIRLKKNAGDKDFYTEEEIKNSLIINGFDTYNPGLFDRHDLEEHIDKMRGRF